MEISLRPAASVDVELLFRWRNLPAIVARGSRQDQIPLEEHLRWFRDALAQPERRRIFLIEHAGTPIGQVRFDRGGGPQCTISAYVVPEHGGHGFGRRAIELGCFEIFRLWAVDEIIAHVRHDNPRGRAAFEAVGFVQRSASAGAPAEHHELVCHRPGASAHRIVPHNRLTHQFAEEAAVARAVASGYWASGPGVARLEARLGEMSGGRHAVVVSSGSSALRLALQALSLPLGAPVALPAYSCVALVNAILSVGAQPITLDLEPDGYNIDFAAATKVVRERGVLAAIIVHTFGVPADNAGARRLGVPIIEDCAHGFGTLGMGGLGDLAVLSFGATKLIGAGAGGAVITESQDRASYLALERDYVDRTPAISRRNDQLSDVTAALAMCQLDRLPQLIAQREVMARRYDLRLRPLARGRFQVPELSPRIWYRYVVQLVHDQAATVVARLAEHGVDAAEPVWKWTDATHARPLADEAYARALSLPLYPTLTDAEQDQVIDVLNQVLA